MGPFPGDRWYKWNQEPAQGVREETNILTFKGKTAIVTGAGQGIGEGIAGALVSLGARVALVDMDEARVSKVAAVLAGDGTSAQAYVGDIRDAEFLADAVGQILEKWGQIDVLVNNAGVIRDNLLGNISEEDWDTVLDVNLKGTFLCCRAVVPHMKERQYGKIVNIASRSALGNVGQANYSASKGGVISFTRTLALELAKYGINVNAVSPGFIDTPMTRGLPAKARERLLRMQPSGKAGAPEDIANAVCFLASDAARFITGQVLNVDGGRSCGLLGL